MEPEPIGSVCRGARLRSGERDETEALQYEDRGTCVVTIATLGLIRSAGAQTVEVRSEPLEPAGIVDLRKTQAPIQAESPPV